MSVDRFFPGEKIYLLDGGMGSLLQKKGLPSGQAPEYMNIHHPEKSVRYRLIEAGSDLIETNTFGGNPITLEKNGLTGLTTEVNQRAAELALEAGESGQVRVVGSIGPTGELLAPLGGLDQDQAEEAFFQQCQVLKAAGIQVVNVETMSDLRELKAAVTAAKKCGLEVMGKSPLWPTVCLPPVRKCRHHPGRFRSDGRRDQLRSRPGRDQTTHQRDGGLHGFTFDRPAQRRIASGSRGADCL